MAIQTYTELVPNNYTNRAASQFYVYLPGVRDGVKLAGYRSKIKNDANATTPYSVDRYFVTESEPLNCTLTRTGYWSPGVPTGSVTKTVFAGYPLNAANYGVSLYAHNATVSADDRADCLSKLYDKIRQESYGTNGFVFLGELRETIRMLRRPLSSVQDFLTIYLKTLTATRPEIYRRVKKKRNESYHQLFIRRKQALVDAMSGTWLETQFGILPAISDAKDICKQAHSILSEDRSKERIRAKSKPSHVVNNIFSTRNAQAADNAYLGTFAKSTTECNVQLTAGLKSTVVGPTSALGDILSKFGLNQVETFVPSIYELMPWSFLIDYFVNLGDIISASVTSTNGVTWACETIRQVTEYEETCILSPYDDPSFIYPGWHNNTMSGSTLSHRKVRHVTLSRGDAWPLGIPSIVFSLPGSDSKKWNNMAALLLSSRRSQFSFG